MDPRIGWILATIGLWIVLRFLVRRRSKTHRATHLWFRSTAKPPRRRSLRFRPFARKPQTPRAKVLIVTAPPHSFPHRGPKPGTWRDISRDGRPEFLQRWGLPLFQNPDELAAWLQLPVNRLAWLAHRCSRGKPAGVGQSHYVPTWKPKRSGGLRLIESPKAQLKAVQRQILSEIVSRLPVSTSAHGFVRQRSILTNARPHTGAAVVVKFDLQDFYVTVTPGRITRLFRRVGYSREAALWLTRLTTSIVPGNLPIPPGDNYGLWRYRHRHLPQGAPTSPALANLVAYCLDQRLTGLARAFGATYTRYADDLTFSGDEDFSKSLRTFIQLVEQIIRSEGFASNRAKRQVLRRHQRQIVAGVVVNEKLNFCRRDYDRLKAALHQCVLRGPASQNTGNHADFAAHLRGRIAHVMQLNPQRGAKLQQIYGKIPWQ